MPRAMRIWVVIKAPVDLEGTAELVGAFTDTSKIDDACKGAGTYTIAEVTADRVYRTGQLLDVSVRRVLGGGEIR